MKNDHQLIWEAYDASRRSFLQKLGMGLATTFTGIPVPTKSKYDWMSKLPSVFIALNPKDKVKKAFVNNITFYATGLSPDLNYKEEYPFDVWSSIDKKQKETIEELNNVFTSDKSSVLSVLGLFRSEKILAGVVDYLEQLEMDNKLPQGIGFMVENLMQEVGPDVFDKAIYGELDEEDYKKLEDSIGINTYRDLKLLLDFLGRIHFNKYDLLFQASRGQYTADVISMFDNDSKIQNLLDDFYEVYDKGMEKVYGNRNKKNQKNQKKQQDQSIKYSKFDTHGGTPEYTYTADSFKAFYDSISKNV